MPPSDTVRQNPYSGPSRLAVPFPTDSEPDEGGHDEAEEAATHEDEQTEDEGTSSGGGGTAPRRRSSATRKAARLLPGGAVLERLGGKGKRRGRRGGDAAGLILSGLLWVWVVNPYLHGGPSQVRAVLRAKFLNQGPDGAPL